MESGAWHVALQNHLFLLGRRGKRIAQFDPLHEGKRSRADIRYRVDL